MKYPQTILDLIECFKKLPGIGEKTAERLTLSLINADENYINLFSKSLKNIKLKIKKCKICNNFSEDELCLVCKDKNRNKKVLCVVEEPKNINLFEKLNIFDGYYHVLGGLISPIDGINPEDIDVNNLIERVKENKVEEVIMALKPSIEGETTSLYISKLLEPFNVNISKIAYGIPMGAEIDYVDSLTLEMALENRMKISSKKS